MGSDGTLEVTARHVAKDEPLQLRVDTGAALAPDEVEAERRRSRCSSTSSEDVSGPDRLRRQRLPQSGAQAAARRARRRRSTRSRCSAVPADEDDQAVIEPRIAEVVAFWRREQGSARYRALVTRLLSEREALTAVGHRPRPPGCGPARGARRRSAQADQAPAGPARRDGRAGWSRPTPAACPGRASSASGPSPPATGSATTVLDGTARPASPWSTTSPSRCPSPTGARLRSTLAAYNQLGAGGRRAAGAEGGRPARSLFDVLGVDPAAPDDAVRAGYEALAARNRQRRHDRLRTVTDELLVLADRHTAGPGRARYRATMVAEARRQLARDDRGPAARRRPRRRGGVRAPRARGGGLRARPAAARAAVIAAAAELGGAVETGPAVDYLLCPACGAVEAVDGRHRACRRCGTDLYRACPSCRSEIEASAYACGHCGADLRALAEAERERRQRLAAAERLTGLERERALADLLADHPGFEPAAAPAGGHPAGAAASGSRPTAGADSIVVSWPPSESPGVTGYRLTRYQADGRGRPGGADRGSRHGGRRGPAGRARPLPMV